MARQTRTLTVAQIVARRETGDTYTAIAETAGLSRTRVQTICDRGPVKTKRGPDSVKRVVLRRGG